MATMQATDVRKRLAAAGSSAPLWLALGLAAWGGLVSVALALLAADPPRAGDDLALLLSAGRDIAAGRSPYDEAIVRGASPAATNLFFSYPPPVAQVMRFVGEGSLPVVLAGLGLAAAASLAVVVVALRRELAPRWPGRTTALAALAVAPLVLPFGIAVLFGNLDALFPFVYGAAVLGAVGRPGWPGIAGVSVALAAVAKLYPAGLGLWFVVRAVRERTRPTSAGRVAAAALATGMVVLTASLLLGGVQPWIDWIAVARVVAGADIVDPRNMGPAAHLALLVGAGEGAARTLHVGVLVVAVAAIVGAAWRLQDGIGSLAVAAVGSLVLLPVSWYHYPAALIPFGFAAVMRDPAPRIVWTVAGAGLLATLGIATPALLWAGVALILVAALRPSWVRAARPRPDRGREEASRPG
jgi:hypothetical protein